MSFRKFLIGFDPHGDQQDAKANDIFFKFKEIWKPDIRIAGGDIFDFRPLRGKASTEERRESVLKDRDMGMEWLQRLEPTNLLLGNHDNRLWITAAKNDGVLSDFCQQGIDEIETFCKSIRCPILPYHKRDGVLRIGRLKVIHGFWSGLHADKQAALCYGSVLMGHTHTISQYATPALDRHVAKSCGCLCQVDMEYNAHTPSSLRHANGFIYGVVDTKSGSYHCWQAESIAGKWILPSDITEIK